MTELKPLFIPLKTEFYEAFEDGSKTVELRKYGNRWNEGTCPEGRAVTLSKGYGKANRLYGKVSMFTVRSGVEFNKESQQAIKECYGTLDIFIACIAIKLADTACK